MGVNTGLCWTARYRGGHAPVTRNMLRMTAEEVDRTLQRGLVVVYGLGVAIGLATIIFSTPSMLEKVGESGANSLGLLMLAGASLCLGGTLKRRGTPGDWFGEYAGLWGVVFATLAWSAVVFSTAGGDPARIAPGLALDMLAALLVVRWFRVRDDARQAIAETKTIPPTVTTR